MAKSVGVRNKDCTAGLLFIGIALVYLILGRDLEVGTPTEMGPGFFPLIVVSLLAILGVIAIVNSLKDSAGGLPCIPWRPLLVIIGAPLIFASLIEYFGLAPALGAAVWFSTLAERPWHPWKSLLLSALAVFFCWLVFAFAFGVPIPLFKLPG